MEESTKQFDNKDFNPINYVNEVSHRCVNSEELCQQYENIKILADETNRILKKNVFSNYTLFIETAKEISRLEGDMYQLSHLLSEQKSLLTTLGSTSVLENQELLPINEAECNKEEEEENVELKRKQALSDIAAKIQGCINLTENSGRFFLYEGDWTELDLVDNRPIHKWHAYLLSDVLLLTSTIANRRSPTRYKLETVYDVTNLAIVNVKHGKHALKLLAFPDTRVFQATSSQAKDEWLEKFEEAKKLHLINQGRKRGSICMEQKSPARANSIEASKNPFEEEDDEIDDSEIVPDWVLEVAEDLDVLIVERHFEDAYTLIEKTRQYLTEFPLQNEILSQDIMGKLDNRVKTLTIILTKELEVTPEKSHQGGFRAARISVKLLNTLKKSTQACDLFLKLCSHLLKTQLRRVQMSTTAVVYVKQLCAVFFLNLCDMSKEFQHHAFPNNPACASSFVVWCTLEVSEFITSYIKPVFTSQTSMITLNNCVELLHVYSERLTEFGLDITYQIDGQLRTLLANAVTETKNKLIENISTKIGEENWDPAMQKTKQQSLKLVSELERMGITGTDIYISDSGHLEIANCTIWFVKAFVQFIGNSSFNVASIVHDTQLAIYSVLSSFCKSIHNSFANEESLSKKLVIQKNKSFLLEKFLPFCDTLGRKVFGDSFTSLEQLRNEFGQL